MIGGTSEQGAAPPEAGAEGSSGNNGKGGQKPEGEKETKGTDSGQPDVEPGEDLLKALEQIEAEPDDNKGLIGRMAEAVKKNKLPLAAYAGGIAAGYFSVPLLTYLAAASAAGLARGLWIARKSEGGKSRYLKHGLKSGIYVPLMAAAGYGIGYVGSNIVQSPRIAYEMAKQYASHAAFTAKDSISSGISKLYSWFSGLPLYGKVLTFLGVPLIAGSLIAAYEGASNGIKRLKAVIDDSNHAAAAHAMD